MLLTTQLMQFGVNYDFQLAKAQGQIFTRVSSDIDGMFEPVVGPNVNMPDNAMVFEQANNGYNLYVVQPLYQVFSTRNNDYGFYYWRNMTARFVWNHEHLAIQMIPVNKKRIPEYLNPMNLDEDGLKAYISIYPEVEFVKKNVQLEKSQ